MRREKIVGFLAEELGAEGAQYEGRWMGYEVWAGKWDEPPCIGPPVFALVRGETIRLTDPDEGFAVLRWLDEEHRRLNLLSKTLS